MAKKTDTEGRTYEDGIADGIGEATVLSDYTPEGVSRDDGTGVVPGVHDAFRVAGLPSAEDAMDALDTLPVGTTIERNPTGWDIKNRGLHGFGKTIEEAVEDYGYHVRGEPRPPIVPVRPGEEPVPLPQPERVTKAKERADARVKAADAKARR